MLEEVLNETTKIPFEVYYVDEGNLVLMELDSDIYNIRDVFTLRDGERVNGVEINYALIEDLKESDRICKNALLIGDFDSKSLIALYLNSKHYCGKEVDYLAMGVCKLNIKEKSISFDRLDPKDVKKYKFRELLK